MPKWIHRSVDLENVAYGDKTFDTKKEAMESAKRQTKLISYVDLVIKTDCEELSEYDNPFQMDCNCEIVYRR